MACIGRLKRTGGTAVRALLLTVWICSARIGNAGGTDSLAVQPTRATASQTTEVRELPDSVERAKLLALVLLAEGGAVAIVYRQKKLADSENSG